MSWSSRQGCLLLRRYHFLRNEYDGKDDDDGDVDDGGGCVVGTSWPWKQQRRRHLEG